MLPRPIDRLDQPTPFDRPVRRVLPLRDVGQGRAQVEPAPFRGGAEKWLPGRSNAGPRDSTARHDRALGMLTIGADEVQG